MMAYQMRGICHMNYIHRLETENRDLRQQLKDVQRQLLDIEVYLTTPKFQGPDNDYVHVRTDILPKIIGVRVNTNVEDNLHDWVDRAVSDVIPRSSRIRLRLHSRSRSRIISTTGNFTGSKLPVVGNRNLRLRD